MSKLALDQIVVAERHRKHMGDLSTLAESMRTKGLLHPVVVTQDKHLIAGQRRIEAARLIGWKEIPVRYAGNLTEALTLIEAERDENTCRLDLLPTEFVSIGKVIKQLETPPAADRMRKGKKITDPGTCRSQGTKNRREPKVRDKVGEALGVSGGHFYRAEVVVDAAEENPELYGDLPAKMDADGEVLPAFKEMKRRKGATDKKESTPSGEPNKAILRAHEAISVMRPILSRISKNDPSRKRCFQIVTNWLKSWLKGEDHVK